MLNFIPGMGETRMGSAWHWRLKWKHFAARQEDPLWLSRSQGEIDLGDPENLEILPLFVRHYIQYIDKEIVSSLVTPPG